MSISKKILLIPFLLILLGGNFIFAQTVLPQPGVPQEDTTTQDTASRYVEIKNADLFESIFINEQPVRRLIGNVHFVHDSTDMFCDTAYQFLDSNQVEARNNVRIVSQRDSMRVSSRLLTYNSGTRILELTDNVYFTDDQVSLQTPHLTYDRAKKFGYYDQTGILKDSSNTLTSQFGYYYPDSHLVLFKKNVKLVNPDYILETDTLAYTTDREVVYFYAPTTIYDSTSELYTEGGWYDTQNQIAFLWQNPYAKDTVNHLSADTIYYNHELDSGWAKIDVTVKDLDKQLFVYGQYGVFRQNPSKTYVADSAYAINYLEQDTLYLFADTLYAEQDSAEERQQIRAFHKVEVFMTGMQAITDSLVYQQDDSLMSFFSDPVLWAGRHQLTGDTVRIWFSGDEVDSMAVGKNAFLASEEDTVGYNQVKSRFMRCKFRDNELRRMDNEGNVESIFFSEDDEQHYMGMNYAKCVEMTVRFEENSPSKINFKEQPEGKFKPIHEVLFQENRLDGFVWRESERPERPWHLIPKDTSTVDSVAQDSVLMDSTLLDSLDGGLEDSLVKPGGGLKGGTDSTLVDSLAGGADSTATDTSGLTKGGIKGGTKGGIKGGIKGSDSTAVDSLGTIPADTSEPKISFCRTRLGLFNKQSKEERMALWNQHKQERKEAREERKAAKRKRKQDRKIERMRKKLERRAERRRKKREKRGGFPDPELE